MICKLTGLVFDEQKILQHLSNFEECPITGVKMTKQDLEQLNLPKEFDSLKALDNV